MSEITGRALHYVFKIANRAKNAHFFRDVLCMKVLRHEEFKEGCDAQCNGPYDNRWSKTMIGYGPESTHFVFELTYNYGISKYEMGNDFGGVTIKSPTAIERAQALNYPLQDSADGRKLLISPDGYKFFIIPEAQDANKDPVVEVNLHCSQLKESITYWNNLLQMTLVCEQNQSALLKYPKSDVLLRLTQIDDPINRAEAYGRIAFSVPKEQQGHINNVISTAKAKILTPLISLDTPGKETVQVIILADPDGHEICFVDEEGFSKLSEMEDNATESLYKYIKKDPFQKEIDVHNQTATV